MVAQKCLYCFLLETFVNSKVKEEGPNRAQKLPFCVFLKINPWDFSISYKGRGPWEFKSALYCYFKRLLLNLE